MKNIAVVLTLIFLAGCGATPYKSGVGYWDNQLGDDTYKVSSWANGFSPDEQADDFILMRSSEIACQRNYYFFEISEMRHSRRSTTGVTAKVQLLHQKGPYDARFILDSLFPKYSLKPSCSFK